MTLLLHCLHFYAHIQYHLSVHPHIDSSPARSVRLSIVLSACNSIATLPTLSVSPIDPLVHSITPFRRTHRFCRNCSSFCASSSAPRRPVAIRNTRWTGRHWPSIRARPRATQARRSDVRRLIAIENHGEIFLFFSRHALSKTTPQTFFVVGWGCQQYFYLVPCLNATLCLHPLFSYLPPSSVTRSGIGSICVCRRVCIPTAAGRLLIGP